MDKLQIQGTFNLIQEIRLIHALVETEYLIDIPALEESKFDAIKARFGIKFADADTHGFDISSYLNVSHAEPFTSVGQIVRPLIFPHSITNFLRSLWANVREYRYSFQGLVTSRRKALLENWIEMKLNQTVRLSDQVSTLSKLRSRIFSRIGFDTTRKKRIGELLIWESDRGRKFPIKAWDDTYFRILANSKFVLCPNGDYIWSYRFFESVLSGAIPIVEEGCSAYNGFRFFSFQDEVTKLKWSIEDAEYNYRICVKKITVPIAILTSEITKIINTNC